MAKPKKHEAEGQAPTGFSTLPVETPPVVETQAADPNGYVDPNAPAEPIPVRQGFYLKMAQADVNGRTDYRFGVENNMPKKAPRLNVTVDGETVEMAVTSSGGYSEKIGYNGWLTARGKVGWILFGDGVNPNDAIQFPDGISFTTVDGTAAANPKRDPKNAEAEARRIAASKAKIAAKKALAAAEAGTPVEGDATEQASSEGQAQAE